MSTCFILYIHHIWDSVHTNESKHRELWWISIIWFGIKLPAQLLVVEKVPLFVLWPCSSCHITLFLLFVQVAGRGEETVWGGSWTCGTPTQISLNTTCFAFVLNLVRFDWLHWGIYYRLSLPGKWLVESWGGWGMRMSLLKDFIPLLAFVLQLFMFVLLTIADVIYFFQYI